MRRWIDRARRRLSWGATVLVAVATAGAALTAGPGRAQSPADRPKVALVLSGGGAAGVAHVGVIRALERLGIRPDIVTGTSMGAVVGGLYASGFTPDDLERAVTEVDWTRILDDASERELIQAQRRDSRLDPLSVGTELPIGLSPDGPRAAAGLVDGVKLTLLLRQMTVHVDHITDFDDLSIPFRAVATDLLTGTPVVLGEGDLGDAMRASMSIPGFFPPVKQNGQVLVDGGVTNNLPIDVARSLGADVVIASFIPPARATEEDVATLTGALSQSMAIYIHARSRALIATLTETDVLLTPGVEDVGMLAFDEAPDTIDEGLRAVAENQAKLERLALGRAPAPPRPSIGDTATQSLTYDRIVIDYDGRLDTRVIRRRLGLPDAGDVTPREIETAARRVYGLELFESVTYRFEDAPDSGERLLVFTVAQRNQGFLTPRVGIVLSNVVGGDSDITVGVGVTVPELTPRGGRLDVDFALGQFDGVVLQFEEPLDYGQTVTLGLNTGFFTQTGTLYARVDDPAAEISTDTFLARGQLEVTPGDWGGFGPFVAFESTGVTLDVGTVPGTTSDSARFDRVQLGLAMDLDTLDDVDLPTRGIQVGAEVGFDAFDSDRVGTVALDALAATSFGRHTISPYALAEGEIDGDQFSANSVGGFPSLPGFDDGELVGDVVAAAGVRYYYRTDFIPYFGSDAFYGGSIAFGGAYADWDDVADPEGGFFSSSVFAGVETIFGPAMVGVGAAEQGQYSGTVTLGTRF